MKILLLGSGGREHALAWKLAQSPRCTGLFIAPGNAGTAHCGQNIDLSPTDFDSLRSFCLKEGIEMLVVGPEEPLVRGIYDYFKADPELTKIPVIGPSKEAAQLEGSKSFAKSFMIRHQIPTAPYREFELDNYEDGVHYLQNHPTPIVLKADGLAAGKGVIICQNPVEAMAEFELMIHQAKFGEASKKVVVEAFLKGIELSVFVLTDGKDYLIFPEAKDYKRVGEGDSGLNTGGMGAVSPVPFADPVFMRRVEERIIRPTVKGLELENLEYQGFIFFGLIKVEDEPYVIEYNCRLGDPETEVILPRLKTDLVELFIATASHRLGEMKIEIEPRMAATIMAVSKGYPGPFEKGYEIEGLDLLQEEDVLVFHAGTREESGKVLTNGGRVFTVTAYGNSIPRAVQRSAGMMEYLYFPGIYYRRDIGYEFNAS